MNSSDGKSLWEAELGDNAELLWAAMGEEPAPQRRRQKRPAVFMWAAMAASWAAIVALAGWNLALQRNLERANEGVALAMLESVRTERVLQGIDVIRAGTRTTVIDSRLIEILQTSRDPNLQLAALELLLAGPLAEKQTRRRILAEIQHNQAFIEQATLVQESRS